MVKDTQISASEFMAIREAIATELRKATTQIQKATLVRQAEQLIVAGYIDIAEVREQITQQTAITTTEAKKEEL